MWELETGIGAVEATAKLTPEKLVAWRNDVRTNSCLLRVCVRVCVWVQRVRVCV